MAATWDAWRWYGARAWAAPEEAAALGALALTLAALGLPRLARWRPDIAVPPWPSAMLLALYAATYGALPPILRCAIAAVAVLFPLAVAAFRRPPPLALWGLAVLALPVVPSLQFTLGYPMRALSAALTAMLLRMQGLAVSSEATFLLWRGEKVQFDAPCSGVNMLWAGLLLTLAAAALLRLKAARASLALAGAVMLTLAANVLRAASLFYVEAGLIAGAAPWWHEGVGFAAFAMSAAGMLWIVTRLSGEERAA